MKRILKYIYLALLSLCCVPYGLGQNIYKGERGVTIRNDSGQLATIHIVVNEELKDSNPTTTAGKKNNVTIKPGEEIELIWPLTIILPPGPRYIPVVKNKDDLFYLTTVNRIKSGQKLRKAAKFNVSVQTNDSGDLTLSYSFSDHLSPAWDESVADGPREGIIYRFEKLENVILDVSQPTPIKEP
ncbi:hypothetical protein P3T73_13060 [Kiritimatiellota bacterium B12222]|nr:hypothetical protein P3T73_13060 [Kiritimatiellota bacterium B12222]